MICFFLTCDPIIVVGGVAEVEGLFSSLKEINKSFEYTMLMPWLGHGLLTDNGKSWRQRRKLLTPTFHSDILTDFVPIFNEQAKILVSRLSKMEGKPVDIYPIVTLCTLDIICETAMGRNVRAQLQEDSDYVKAVHRSVDGEKRIDYRLNEILHQRQKTPWLWNDLTFSIFGRGKEQRHFLNIVKGFTAKVIEERKKLQSANHQTNYPAKPIMDHNHNDEPYENGNYTANGGGVHLPDGTMKSGRRAFLDLLLEMERDGKIDGQGVQDEVDTFMFEGHDTTSAGICWALFCIGGHPAVQLRLHEEIDRIVGHYEDITSDHLKQLEYLEICVKESLRLYPSAPLIGRKLQSDFRVGKNTIPAGSRVLINIFAIHRDGDYWDDPFVFNPERFTKENSAGRHPFAFVPFAAGARNCIGQRFAIMEEKVVIATILKSFKVTPVLRQDQVKVTAELILRSSNGILLQFDRR